MALLKICTFIEDIVKEVGKPKFEYKSAQIPEEIMEAVKELCYDEIKVAVLTDDKTVRDARMDDITNRAQEALAERFPDSASAISEGSTTFEKKIIRVPAERA